MNRTILAGLACLSTVGAVEAGGIDRSGQPIDLIFKDGNYAELGYAFTNPTVSGDDISGSVGGIPTDADYTDVAKSFASFSGGVKVQATDKLSFALLGAEDFGSDVRYEETPGSNIGGTHAISDTFTLSLIGRYAFNPSWSVHAGLRAQQASGDIALGGNAYGGPTQPPGSPIPSGVSGYSVKFEDDLAYGYLVGGAFEIPRIAARVAVTYYSPITHKFETTETFAVDINADFVADITNTPESGRTEVELPQSVNVDFQTGIAEDTLLFGSVRWAEWTDFEIAPENFQAGTGVTLVTLDEDTYTYRLGLGHRLNENWSVSGALAYEAPGDRLKSPLAPTTGFQQVELGARYSRDRYELSTGMRYRWLGDAFPETGTPDVARADFDGNTALTLGVRFGVYF